MLLIKVVRKVYHCTSFDNTVKVLYVKQSLGVK